MIFFTKKKKRRKKEENLGKRNERQRNAIRVSIWNGGEGRYTEE